MDRLVAVARSNRKKAVITHADAKALNRLWHSPPMYVKFELPEKTAWRLHTFHLREINRTMMTLMWKRVTRHRRQAFGTFTVNRRGALALLCLFDREFRHYASEGLDEDDTEE
jgi:hypothetical protein